MNSYKLTVAYDGTQYAGWQSQEHKPSIAQTLNDSFKRVFKKEMSVLGASRTDAGVHAVGQVARARTDLMIELEKLRWVWNNSLPPDISIRSIEAVDDTFNPFLNVVQKTYYYHFFLDRPIPFLQQYGYYYPYKVDLDLLRQSLQFFVGTHDFYSFRSSHDIRKDTIRTIDTVGLMYSKRYNLYRITVQGQKFLRHMIRRIVGASLYIAAHKKGIDVLQNIMDARDPAHTLPNAPAQGLMLYKIIYNK